MQAIMRIRPFFGWDDLQVRKWSIIAVIVMLLVSVPLILASVLLLTEPASWAARIIGYLVPFIMLFLGMFNLKEEMSDRQQLMAEILSCITGIPRGKLRKFEPLRTLLKKADKPMETPWEVEFGLFTFQYPGLSGEFSLGVQIWSEAYKEMRSLEVLHRPVAGKSPFVLAAFSLSDHSLELHRASSQ